MTRHYRLTDEDREVMRAAARLETGGMASFTAHYFSPIHGHPRWDLVWENNATPSIFEAEWDDRVNPDDWDIDAERGDYVPWVPLSWQAAIAHDDRLDVTVIAAIGTGKTLGVGATLLYWACMIPGFKGMNVAPLGWQAKQMFDAIRMELLDWDNRDTIPRYGHSLITKFVERPYPKITCYNGSTLEFMSADEQGGKIYSWSGDVIVVDEADKLALAHTDFEEVTGNLGTRMRGQVGGRARLGKLIVLANAGYDPALWERFDMAEKLPGDYLSIGLTTYDNPLITKEQLRAIGRRITDEDKRKQLLMNERPLPQGDDFPPTLLGPCQDPNLDAMLEGGLQNELPGYHREVIPKAGTVLWALPPTEFDRYILVGDPGQASPPNRNSAVIMAIRVTGFPHVPAELAAFHWVDGRGSYWPFINKMDEWYKLYKPIWAAFDATGVQKGFDELVFAQRGLLMDGINVQGQKMQMVTALKLILGKQLLLLPKEIQGIWLQLAGWRMPDTKLRQDIASCLFMAAHVLNRLFVIDEEEAGEEDDDEYVEIARPARAGQRIARRNTERFARS